MMTEATWNSVWERARTGGHTLVMGLGPVPPAPSDLKVLRVSCNMPLTTGGPLDEARRRVEALLGEDLLHYDEARAQLLKGLRSRLLDDVPVLPIDAVFVEECNRLADWSEGHALLLFESVDAADEATLETLKQILTRAGWLRLPLVVTLRASPKGAAAALVEAVRDAAGEGAIIESAAPDTVPVAAPLVFDWALLPRDVLRVLRAGAVIGVDFEADLIAGLLDEPLGSVLEKLQYAADNGAPLADRGQGRFSLSPEAGETLKRTMLPSLLGFWHERLAGLLGGERSTEHPAPPARQYQRIPGRAATREPAERRSSRAGEGPGTAPGSGEDLAKAPTPSPSLAGLFEPSPLSTSPETALPAQGEPARPSAVGAALPVLSTGGPMVADELRVPGMPGPAEDQARAAAHLQAAGQAEASAERYLAAVREAAARGDTRRAYLLAQQALKSLDELPTSGRRALLRAQVLLEMGRLQWHGAVVGAPFTLQGALESLEAARSCLPDKAPPRVAGELAAVTAGVCYDLGDLGSLQQALDELTAVSRRLLDAGEAGLAARLLNDQAAVYVRMGDPVRATHLLSRSRELFGNLLRDNPEDLPAVEESAETDHLLARIPLHAQIRPGQEQNAYTICLDHALAAERAYRRLEQPRELARVWETMGRLELRRGRLEVARERLSTAFDLQKRIGDVTGLARSTAALADLFVRAGRLQDACALLAESVTLNAEKGSPIGLAFNRRALDALTAAVAGRAPEAGALREPLAEVEQRLSQAESIFGRLVLPGEGDAGS